MHHEVMIELYYNALHVSLLTSLKLVTTCSSIAPTGQVVASMTMST